MLAIFLPSSMGQVALGQIANTDSGNINFAQTMATCEMPAALISACLPSIFNLVKHGAEHFVPNLYAKLSGSHSSSGPGGKCLGIVGEPIYDRKERGFLQLGSERFNTTTSNERLYDGRNGASHYSAAFPATLERERREEDPEMDIPLHRIHVRDDIDISARGRM